MKIWQIIDPHPAHPVVARDIPERRQVVCYRFDHEPQNWWVTRVTYDYAALERAGADVYVNGAHPLPEVWARLTWQEKAACMLIYTNGAGGIVDYTDAPPTYTTAEVFERWGIGVESRD